MKYFSPETRAKMRAARLGKTMPAETRAKIGAALIGNHHTKGYRHSSESRRKWSLARQGHETSAETRAKIGLANALTAVGNRSVKDAPVIGECVYCLGPATTYDHVIPRGRPGWDDPDNIVPACRWCNAQKHRRTPDEWLAAILRTAGEA